jgi:hypothetical protein
MSEGLYHLRINFQESGEASILPFRILKETIAFTSVDTKTWKRGGGCTFDEEIHYAIRWQQSGANIPLVDLHLQRRQLEQDDTNAGLCQQHGIASLNRRTIAMGIPNILHFSDAKSISPFDDSAYCPCFTAHCTPASTYQIWITSSIDHSVNASIDLPIHASDCVETYYLLPMHAIAWSAIFSFGLVSMLVLRHHPYLEQREGEIDVIIQKRRAESVLSAFTNCSDNTLSFAVFQKMERTKTALARMSILAEPVCHYLFTIVLHFNITLFRKSNYYIPRKGPLFCGAFHVVDSIWNKGVALEKSRFWSARFPPLAGVLCSGLLGNFRSAGICYQHGGSCHSSIS